MSHLRVKRMAAENGPYAAAVAHVPGYAEAWAVATEADERLRALLTAAPVKPRDPLSTGHIGDEWLQAAADAETSRAATEVQRRILAQLRERAHATVVSVVTMHADAILTSLDNDLADVMDRGRRICAALNGARTAAQAITEGAAAAKAWGQLAELLGDYRQIRAAQTAVMLDFVPTAQAAKSPRNPDPRASDLLLSNLDEVSPGWGAGAVDFSGRPTWAPPWPDDDTEHLVWLIQSDAEPWCPTMAQLEQLWASRRPVTDFASSPSSDGWVHPINQHPTTIKEAV